LLDEALYSNLGKGKTKQALGKAAAKLVKWSRKNIPN
jgi:hypothetical protein